MNCEVREVLRDFFKGGQSKAFLVGADISHDAPSNLPLAQGFIENIIAQVSNDGYTRTDLIRLCTSNREGKLDIYDFLRFEGIIEILQKHVDAELDILNCFGESHAPNENHYLLANLTLNGHVIMTTNFDQLIELALQEMGKPFEAVLNDGDFASALNLKDQQLNKNPIFKLHGTINIFSRSPHQWINARNSVVATIEGLAKMGHGFRNSPGKFRFLKSVLETHDLVVIGYSGGDDFDICELLVNIETDRKLLWINHSTKNKNGTIITRAEIENCGRDEQGNVIEPMFDLLNRMGLSRPANNTVLVNIDTSEVRAFLTEQYHIDLHDSRSQVHNKEYHLPGDYFRRWANNKIIEKGQKGMICGELYFSLGRFEKALPQYEQILGMYAKDERSHILYSANHHTGEAYKYLGELEKAEKFLEQAVSIATQLGDERLKVNAVGELATILSHQGRIEAALKTFYDVMALFQKMKDLRGISGTLINIGNIYLEKKDYPTALKVFDEALMITEEMNDLDGQTRALHGKGTTLYHLGRQLRERQYLPKAWECYEDEFEICSKALGDYSAIAMIYHQQGNILMVEKEYDSALEVYKKSLKMKQKLSREKESDREGVANTYYQMGLALKYIAQERGFNQQISERALYYFENSLRIDRLIGNKSRMSESLMQIGCVYEQMGILDKSQEYIEKSVHVIDYSDNPVGLINPFGKLGDIYARFLRFEDALKCYLESLHISETFNIGERAALMRRKIGEMEQFLGPEQFQLILEKVLSTRDEE
ncbi:MAG: tetratricopeptide repeat protein [Candidatus Aminicenantes bacterium]|nr:tetratricopeptide repeat protein [Candidatus Aminicenantes bacterium]NIM82518.1 tetratricopeptide repeat protein [Candidatus Aminicenantes bacterium]NIN21876.1 tetratricopeptide repeat protein [Candidatus Aminicenantes bacterium]NIN45654.1 tetratricopeptide repeat protein [Candidatus Aminicenantes bacterium]NIN88487.1 tetratricopeptide repeat protein [Candidatus Aminicenantes bacterium]